MTFFYHAYGLNLESELELPELVSSKPTGGGADIQVIIGDISKNGLSEGRQIAPYIWVGPDQFWLNVPNVAHFLVSEGRHITVNPEPDIDMDSVRVFLLGSVLGALLFQRGMLVLHGNAIEVGGGCLVCVGPSGIGKSTLTAAFVERDYRVLADDVVLIDSSSMAIPGIPRIKLWQDVADRLGICTDDLPRIRPSLEKFNKPLEHAFCDKPKKVLQICKLSHHLNDRVTISPVTGVNKFNLLRANTYRRRIMAGMGLGPQHLKQCGELAAQVSMARVRRPKEGFKIDELVDALIHHSQTVG